MSADHAAAKLPAETLTLIARNLDSLSDVLALANTCKIWRNVFQSNVWDMARDVIPRCMECPTEALTLAALQENFPIGAAQGYSMTPEILRRIAHNAVRLEKAKAWFNKEVMKQIRPSETAWCMEVWGTPRRPPTMTKTEEVRFERAYYLTVALLQPTGRYLLDTIVLRHLYYVYDITHLNFSIAEEEGTNLLGELEKRARLRDDCYTQMKKLWDRFLPERDLKSQNTLALGPHAFGCLCQHLTLFDHYQSQIRTELLPKQRWSAPVNVTKEELVQFVWGQGNYDDNDT
ncbi:hypothetical protein HJFPF1_12440 [Paramyrothecium foliicola]|nr:hypothetical protein HJFPF1_12440 [Paramyrothecium foliicola]